MIGAVTKIMTVTIVIGERTIKIAANVSGHAGKRTVEMGDGRKVLWLKLRVVSICRPIVATTEYSIFLIMTTDRSWYRMMHGRERTVTHAERPASIDWREFSQRRHRALVVIVNVGSRAWCKT
jgi:hypothetical protein